MRVLLQLQDGDVWEDATFGPLRRNATLEKIPIFRAPAILCRCNFRSACCCGLLPLRPCRRERGEGRWGAAASSRARACTAPSRVQARSGPLGAALNERGGQVRFTTRSSRGNVVCKSSEVPGVWWVKFEDGDGGYVPLSELIFLSRAGWCSEEPPRAYPDLAPHDSPRASPRRASPPASPRGKAKGAAVQKVRE